MTKLPLKLKKHYLSFSTYTYLGPYEDLVKHNLPSDIREIGLLVRKNFIHRTTLEAGNIGTNTDLRFGDMNQIPWWRQPEDDVLQTAAAMLAELYRRDSRGLTLERKPEDKLVLTCRYVAILVAAILKAKNISCRVRAGHAPYFDMGNLGNISTDHWINQYWDEQQERWITIDVDGSLSFNDDTIDPYDIPEGTFDFAADAWLSVRHNMAKPEHFYNAGGFWGLNPILWSLAYDFHSLMNHEIIYNHGFAFGEPKRFKKLATAELGKIDHLAELMQHPDRNFDALETIWNTDKDFRLLVGSLL